MEKSKYIWLDGDLVDWDSANVSVMTHTLHYGTGVFEGFKRLKRKFKEKLKIQLDTCTIF